jgi:hypothetical protein
MEELDNIFKFKFYNNGVTPESFSLKELGNLLINIEDSLKSVIDSNYPEINTDDVNLSLVNIKDESDDLFISTLDSPKETINALKYFSESIQNNSYVNLPFKAYNGVKHITQLVKEKECNAEISYKNESLCTITYNYQLIKPESVILKTDTVLYGELIKIGGDEAKAWIELTNGNKINFKISKDQAIQLCPYLYNSISIKGRASWNPQSDFFTDFKLYDILDYKPGNISNAFKELREATSGVWNNIENNEDINKFLNRE